MYTNKQTAVKEIASDVLVIGGGMGGCCAAITAKENGAEEVVLVEKSHAGTTGPSALVGGVFPAILADYDPDEMLKSVVERGDFLVDQEAHDKLIRSGPEAVKSLERWGAKFVKGPDGKYGRWFSRGVLTLALDGGGMPLMKALRSYALKIGIQIFDWITTTDLLTRDANVVGAIGFSCRTGEFLTFKSRATILATGGTLFKSRQPGHRQLTGDGWAMAYRAGAEIAGMDISTSNVYGATLEVGPGNGLYMSQGARMLNSEMEEYIKSYPAIEKLVSPEMHLYPEAMERKRGKAPPIWLDMRHFTPEQVEMICRSVPYAARRWEKLGFLKGKRFVKLCEYAPEGPRPGGGVLLDPGSFEARNLQGLFVCGEAGTLFQSPKNLAYANMSGVIAGKSAAERASKMEKVEVEPRQVEELRKAAMAPIAREKGIDPDYVLTMIQDTIHPYYVHILRSEKHLQKAIEEMDDLRDNLLSCLRAYDPHYLRLANDVRNMALCVEMFLKSALERKESRIGAMREDYPYTDNANWLKWVIVQRVPQTGGMEVKTEDIPIERYKFKPKREKVLHPFWARAEELGYWERPKEE